eukprot:1158758-Pelagomonas_calceolata.AAC.13
MEQTFQTRHIHMEGWMHQEVQGRSQTVTPAVYWSNTEKMCMGILAGSSSTRDVLASSAAGGRYCGFSGTYITGRLLRLHGHIIYHGILIEGAHTCGAIT